MKIIKKIKKPSLNNKTSRKNFQRYKVTLNIVNSNIEQNASPFNDTQRHLVTRPTLNSQEHATTLSDIQ